MALIAERKLNAHGIGIILGDGVQSFEKQADGTFVVHSQKGKTLPADFVIVSSEIQPDTDFLNESGIALGNRGDKCWSTNISRQVYQTSMPSVTLS